MAGGAPEITTYVVATGSGFSGDYYRVDSFSTWQFTRSLTYDFLKTLKSEDLLYSPQLEFGTIGKQIRHVGDVQDAQGLIRAHR